MRWCSRAGRRALGALASAGPGAATRLGALPARDPGRGRAARGATATRGRGARARARWTRAGRLLVDRTVHFFSTDVAPPGGKNHPPFRSSED